MSEDSMTEARGAKLVQQARMIVEKVLAAPTTHQADEVVYAELATLHAEHDRLVKWKTALEDAAVVNWCLTTENKDNPQQIIDDIVAWNVQIALHPAVSQQAHELVARAENAESSVQALRQALEWSLRYLDMLTFEAGGAYYAQAGRMELAGFGAALEKAKAALALPGEKETK